MTQNRECPGDQTSWRGLGGLTAQAGGLSRQVAGKAGEAAYANPTQPQGRTSELGTGPVRAACIAAGRGGAQIRRHPLSPSPSLEMAPAVPCAGHETGGVGARS